ncbi:SusD/RagB family nutrient-binding outer membrane lipoprotein [Chitinophaga ginsengisoli]|uniref:SusD-like starch-binding protein associating with outer membrane n=1 Tax=Chitinophaga ginsengisoli TaxID=363837 RepID=A0A2P8GP69_9BACT|nr:SusD/RagB family nutrient-binding outer membrane lipoprotein [Chitinophaga ginsengisoli]PSL35761.1 SusD-like starch-binding protein associating with outer membrane [Chitinophaga ginsengisoli]
MKFLKIFLLAGLLSACTHDFSETNTNENNPTSVTPDLLLSGVIRNMMNQQVNSAWGIGNIVVQHHAKIQFVNEDRYLWGEQNGTWDAVYNNYRNLQNILRAVGTDSTSPYLGVALVLKSWMFAQVTDAYGDVPYSQAGRANLEGIYQPEYDKQEDVYTGILKDLRIANALLVKARPNLEGDILYGGGATAIVKWRKLANSLRLRYLLRLSKQKDVSAEMTSILADAATYPVFTGNEDNAELKYLSAAPNQWPMYTARVGSFDEFRVSQTLVDRLTTLGDPRLKVFGRPTQKSVAAGTPVISGIPNGLNDADALKYNGGVQGVSRVGYTFACLVCNDIGQAPPDPAAPRALLMTYAELEFTLAEARERNMITTGDAATYYANGITANFNYWKSIVPAQYGIDVTMPANYLTQATVAYTGAQAEKLAKIALQKWIAYYFNGLEAWFDWKRTGMPAIVPGPSNLNDNKVPVRFIYPQKEQSLNGTNRNTAVSRQGADDLNTRPWIAK